MSERYAIDHPLPDDLAGGNVTITDQRTGDEHSAYLTGHLKAGPHTIGAFIAQPPLIRGNVTRMHYARLGRTVDPGKPLKGAPDIIVGATREVVEVRRITRDEFDRLTGLDRLRRDLGWRDHE